MSDVPIRIAIEKAIDACERAAWNDAIYAASEAAFNAGGDYLVRKSIEALAKPILPQEEK